MEKERTMESEILGVRLRAWVIGVVCLFLVMALGLWAGLYMIVLSLGMHWEMMGPMIAPPVVLMMLGLLSYYGGPSFRLRPGEYALIYSMLNVGVGMTAGIYPYEMFYYFGMAARVSERWLEIYPDMGKGLVPAYFAPTDKTAIDAMLYGGQPVPWAAWIPVLSYFIAYHILMYFMFSFTMLILRKQWIEIERLQYPYAVPAMRIISDIAAAKSKSAPARLIIIGFAASFLFHMIDFPHMINPAIPGLPFWSNYFAKWNYELRTLLPSLAEAMPGSYFQIPFGPIWMIAALIFVPSAIQISGWFFHILFMVLLPPVLIMAGIMPWGPTMAPWGAYRLAAFDYFVVGNYAILWVGVFALLFQWRYLVGTLKGLVGRADVSEEREFTSYRNLWIGMIVSFVVFVALTLAVGGSLPGAFGAVLCLWLFNIGLMRVRGEGGMMVGGVLSASMNMSPPHYWFVRAEYPAQFTDADMTTDYFVNYTTVAIALDKWNSQSGGFSGQAVSEGFRVLEEEKVHARAGFGAMTLAYLIGTVVSLFVALPIIYSVGTLNVSGLTYYWTSYGGPLVGNPLNYMAPDYATQAGPPWLEMGISAVLVLVLMFLRYRFIWWPLHAIGIIYGLGTSAVHGWPYLLLYGWIIKTLSMRIGGARFYEDKVAPICVGLAVGGFFAYMMLATVGMYFAGGGWFTWGPP